MRGGPLVQPDVAGGEECRQTTAPCLRARRRRLCREDTTADTQHCVSVEAEAKALWTTDSPTFETTLVPPLLARRALHPRNEELVCVVGGPVYRMSVGLWCAFLTHVLFFTNLLQKFVVSEIRCDSPALG